MRNRRNGKPMVAATVAVLAAVGYSLMQAQPASLAQQTGGLLAQLGDSNRERRSEAFYQLADLGRTLEGSRPDEPSGEAIRRLAAAPANASVNVKTRLNDTLAVENRIVQQQESLTEDYTSYYGDLIAAVTAFRDASSAPALSDAVGTGNMVLKTLARFGDVAVEPMLRKMNGNTDAISKQAACLVLGRLVDPANQSGVKDEKQRTRIKVELKKAATAVTAPYLRVAAVTGLARLKDRDLVPFMAQIAEKDSYDASKLVEDANVTKFPVRGAALSALKQMGQEGSPVVQKEALRALTAIATRQSGSVREEVGRTLEGIVKDDTSKGEVKKEASDALRKLFNLKLEPKKEEVKPVEPKPAVVKPLPLKQ